MQGHYYCFSTFIDLPYPWVNGSPLRQWVSRDLSVDKSLPISGHSAVHAVLCTTKPSHLSLMDLSRARDYASNYASLLRKYCSCRNAAFPLFLYHCLKNSPLYALSGTKRTRWIASWSMECRLMRGSPCPHGL